jgi:septal ring factor EnvC (AmiA/AmiB activator)
MIWRSLAWASLGIGLLLPWQAKPNETGLEQEREQVRERLVVERAALVALREEKLEILEVLDFVEKLARTSSARAAQLEAELRSLRARVQFVRRQRQEAGAEVRIRLERLAPRLFVLYRLLRFRRLQTLLSATDFASLMWRGRAMRELTWPDLEDLREAKRIWDFEQLLSWQLENLSQELERWGQAARDEADRATARQTELARAIGSLRSDAVQAKRIVRELEEQDQALSRLVKQLQLARTSGFAALRGHLSLPVEGVVEMGFGKVINPKFNTITVQKGWDIRASKGAAVLAVADGQVVHAGWLRGYGNVLILDHGDGFHTLLAHLDSFSRAVGESVRAGEAIAAVGDTGSLKGDYLYFEIRQDGEAVDPSGWVRESSLRSAPEHR